jgi:uncharacterized protein YcfL
MKARWSTGTIAAAAFLAGLAGLGTSCKAFEPRGTAQNTYVGKNDGTEVETIEGDSSLANDLVMEGIQSERRDGRLFVQFNLKNTKSSNLTFEWTMEWFDASGFKINAAQHWTPVAIGGKGYETITQTAPTPAASSWRLGLRKPNSVR